MAYSWRAVSQRQCIATKIDGTPCRAWAVWADTRQLCIRHSGRWRATYDPHWYAEHQPARYEPCTCIAYNWPHRPGGGLCCWPDQPEYRRTTPAGTRRGIRLRVSRDFLRALKAMDRVPRPFPYLKVRPYRT